MEILVGAVLALLVGLFAMASGMERDRAFYPVLAIVVATYYALFAVLGGSARALALECVVVALYVVAAVAGFRGSLWLIVVALAGHGVFDYFHGDLVDNPGVPAWWPGFCGTFDVVAAAWLAWRLALRR